MTATVVPLADRVLVPADADRPTWLAARPSGLGGSEVASALGLNRWCSPYELWCHKTGLLAETDEPPSEAARWGTLLEPLILAEFAVHHNVPVWHPWERQGPTFAHPEHPWARCTPDAFNGPLDTATAVVSAKSTTEWLSREWDADKAELPAAALAQVWWEFFVTGLSEAWVVALVGACRLVPVHVVRDDQAVEDLVALAAGWWERHVVGGRPPGPVGTDAEATFLGSLWPVSMGDVEVLDWSEFAVLGRAKLAAEADINEAKQRKTAAEDGLRLLLGSATEGVCDDDLLVTWREQQGKTTPDLALVNDGINRAAMAAAVLTDAAGAGSAEGHDDAGHVLLEALDDMRRAMTSRSDPTRVLRLTKKGREVLGG